MFYLWLKTQDDSSPFYHNNRGSILGSEDRNSVNNLLYALKDEGWSVATEIDYGEDTLMVLTQRPLTS